MEGKIGSYICTGSEGREKEPISGLWAEENEAKTFPFFVLPLCKTGFHDLVGRNQLPCSWHV
jgi:hypothetical protein